MATAAPQRETRTMPRYTGISATQKVSYSNRVNSAAARALEYPLTRPQTPPVRMPQARPASAPKIQKQEESKLHTGVQKQSLLRFFAVLGGVFLLCFLMIYRYAVILETNDKIAELKASYAAVEAGNQALQTKLDRGLELGSLEEYATGQLGMIRPDSTQVFYVDVQMANTTSGQEDAKENRILQGTPGALMHAIRVLK